MTDPGAKAADPNLPLGAGDVGETRPFVRLDRVVKRFGGFVAVNGVTLDIARGELFCLLGGSGCGKSTLLRMLAGFEHPDSGRIEIDGQTMAGVPAYARPTNMMFQSYALFPHMSVARNVGYGLVREGVARAEIGQRVEEMLRLVRLETFGDRRPHQLSGGQRQRVALARALIKRPKLLLLDEPLGALDAKLREETQFELRALQARRGVTFIVVTHDQVEAMTLASRIGVMEAGEIRQIGAPRAVYEQPQSRFVAGFLGSVNLFEGTVDVAAPDLMRIRTPGGGFVVPPASGLSARQPVALAVRPEKMRIAAGAAQADNALQAVVEERAYLGDRTMFKLRLNDGTVLKVLSAAAEAGVLAVEPEAAVDGGGAAADGGGLTA